MLTQGTALNYPQYAPNPTNSESETQVIQPPGLRLSLNLVTFSGRTLGQAIFQPILVISHHPQMGIMSFSELLNRTLQQFEPKGPPPTSKEVLEKLPQISVAEEI